VLRGVQGYAGGAIHSEVEFPRNDSVLAAAGECAVRVQLHSRPCVQKTRSYRRWQPPQVHTACCLVLCSTQLGRELTTRISVYCNKIYYHNYFPLQLNAILPQDSRLW
jgi:hypothetical protein